MLTEAQKRLNLVEFSLNKRGYSRNEYVLSFEEVDELPSGYSECGFGIVKYQNKWAVYIYDRSIRHQIAMHDSILTAVTDFYWRCINAPTQYEYREEWEITTGLKFEIGNDE